MTDATDAFLEAHLKAYGSKLWAYKHHMARHIGEMYLFFGVLLSCFVQERRHRLIKRFLRDVYTRDKAERTFMQQLFLQNLWDLQDFDKTPDAAVGGQLLLFSSDLPLNWIKWEGGGVF